MSNHKRISKKRNEKKAVSDKQNIEKFIVACGEMCSKFLSISIEMNKVFFSNEKFCEIGEEIILQD